MCQDIRGGRESVIRLFTEGFASINMSKIPLFTLQFITLQFTTLHYTTLHITSCMVKYETAALAVSLQGYTN